MANASNQKNGTETETSFQGISPSECIAWLTVFMAESVAIVILNFLTVLVFIRNRSLRKRSMYLVISLAVADMLVGGCSEISKFFFVWRIVLLLEYPTTTFCQPCLLLLAGRVSCCFSDKPRCNLVRTNACDVSPFQTSYY